jgi:hypothetical protein
MTIAFNADFIKGLHKLPFFSSKNDYMIVVIRKEEGLRIGPWSYPDELRGKTDQMAAKVQSGVMPIG